MDGLIWLVIIVGNAAFYIWFGATMNSMLAALREINASQKTQTRLLAALANKAHEGEFLDAK